MNHQPNQNTSPKPFRIDIPQHDLDDLHARLAHTRWPGEVEGAGWDYGTNLAYLKGLTEYWQHGFDWREQERQLNNFQQFRAEIDGFGLHFIHERGRGPNPTPLLLTHGWPDSFYRFYKLIPMLTDPERFGGRAEDSFDVVVPSIPGYGFSDQPSQRGFSTQQTADLFARLMTEELGYVRYGAHGGDVGSSVTEALATRHAEQLLGIHLTDIPYWHLFATSPNDLSDAEQTYIQTGKQWQMREGAYALEQSTKPQTLAYGLSDSPAGLAAWIVEKFRSWSDCDGDIGQRFSRDELLTNLTIYWATQTIQSSFLPYFERPAPPQGSWTRPGVPTGVAIFPKDIVPAPQEYGERIFDIRRWTPMPRGGHFAALEEPALLADDLRSFFGSLRD